MNIILAEFIKQSLSHYDLQLMKWYKLINTSDVIISFDKITFGQSDFDYELLGYYDNQNKIFIWGWVLPEFDHKKLILAKEILMYGINLESGEDSIEHSIIKSILVNSRIQLEDYIELTCYLSIISYIIKDKISFIYPHKRYINSNKDYITVYYFIK